ncbi:transcriptional repressor LexA [Limisalsivibrio acetivorans]|uniref:transcriptional repressor LexA n=1 Tax=Limisalsivibrio acetivorans TaxID=1304888 RepID=UPI0003B73973|nr:transcriptional repressor LexA [Limisalsivibrio acetivorans]
MGEPTEKQKRFLDYIENFSDTYGYSPSVREIAGGLGLSSTASVKKMLDRLEERGFIRRGGSGTARGIELLRGRSFPVLGRIQAGVPVTAEENIEGYISLKDKAHRDCFFLKVEGESMKDKGILDGDFALIRPVPVVNSGKIGVFRLNGEVTLKTFRKGPEGVFLLPANEDFEPIPVGEYDEFETVGSLVMVVRLVEGSYDPEP